MLTDPISHPSSSATVEYADAGQCVSFALKRIRRVAVRKGMVIVSKTETPPNGQHSLRQPFTEASVYD
jgi:GTPase